MKKTLLLLVMISVITVAFAQKRKKVEQPITGYAITAIEKGGRSWKEVRLVDVGSGEVVKNIYDSKQETEALNARTGKAVAKKDESGVRSYTTTINTGGDKQVRKVVNLDQEL